MKIITAFQAFIIEQGFGTGLHPVLLYRGPSGLIIPKVFYFSKVTEIPMWSLNTLSKFQVSMLTFLFFIKESLNAI